MSDVTNQVIITPQTKEMPDIEARGKKVIVTFNEALRPNTTYRIFFGGAIADMREGNKLSDFEFVFSTGNSIDSLYAEGKVKNAFSLKPEKDVTVALYDTLETDSVVYKKKPLYLSKSNAEGQYKLTYLPRAPFKAFAFFDKNKNLMYDGGEESIGFRDSLMRVGTDTVANFRMFREESKALFIKKSYSPLYGIAYIIYNKELMNHVVPFSHDQKDKIFASDGRNDTCRIFYYGIYDTLKLMVHHGENVKTDTVNIPVLPQEQFEKLKKGGKILLDVLVEPLVSGKVPFNKQPVVVFNKWMDFTKTDTSKLKISSKADSTISPAVITKEPGTDRIVIGNKLKPSSDYRILIDKGAFTDKLGIVNDSLVLSFSTNTEEDYGRLDLKLVLPSKENFIVQLTTAQEKVMAEQYVESSIASSTEHLLQFKHLLPGEYFVKVIEDKNGNKRWDSGHMMRRKQPEPVYFNAQAVKLLADWDADIEWKIIAE